MVKDVVKMDEIHFTENPMELMEPLTLSREEEGGPPR
jgi:hypothetical protein